MKRLYALLLLLPGAFNANAQSINLSLNSGYVINNIISEPFGYIDHSSATTSIVSFSAISYTKTPLHFGLNASISQLTSTWAINYIDLTTNPDKLTEQNVFFGKPVVNICAILGVDFKYRKSEFLTGIDGGLVIAKSDVSKNKMIIEKDYFMESSRGISYGVYFRYGYNFFHNIGVNAEVRPTMYSLTLDRPSHRKYAFLVIPIMLGVHVRI